MKIVLSLLLLISLSCHAQVFKFKTVAYACVIFDYQETNNEFQDLKALVTVDYTNDQVKFFTSSNQLTYDIIKRYPMSFEEGSVFYDWFCVDKDAKKCDITMIRTSDYKWGIKIAYADAAYIYILEANN